MKLGFMQDLTCGKHIAKNTKIFGNYVTLFLIILRVKIQKPK